MEPPWDQVYARDVPPDFDEMRKREDRKERIKPFWDLLVTDKEPKVNKESLVRLVHDLKEEGNTLFKEALFDIAWMHYRNAIFVVKILENRFYHTIEKEFTSSLFSNRAFCCLKKSMYKEAAQDCESAIGVYPKNIKAYYRQALAYKHMKNYKEAYKSACKGQDIQPSSALKELLDELEIHVKPSSKAPGSNIPRVAEASAKSATTVTIGNQQPVPDDDWLSGTNIKVTEKHLETKSKLPTKKSKKKSKSAVPLKMSDELYRDDEEDEESDEMNNSLGVEDDHEFANMFKGVQQGGGSTLLNGGRTIVGTIDIQPPREDEETAWSFPHDSDDDQPININTNTGPISAMGLDSFSPKEQLISESDPTSFNNSATSSGRSSRSSQSPIKFTTVTSKHSSSSPSPAQEAVPNIIFPFIDEFDFKIACRHCFSKIGEGVKGYRYVNAAHTCLKDNLIIKKKNPVNLSWVKVRSLPDTKSVQHGVFKICTQFSQAKPCKVGEEKCTFPHHQAELRMWLLDREGKFSVEEFVTKCRTFNITSSHMLEQQRSKQQYIPGLNYAGDKNKKQQTQELVRPPSPDVDPAPYQPQLAIEPPSRQNSSQAMRYNTTQQVLPQNRYMPPPTGLLGHAPQMSQVSPPDVYKTFPPPFMAGQFSQPPPALPPQDNHAPQQWSRRVPAVLEEPDVVQFNDQITDKLENPLSATYSHIVVCQNCFKPTIYPGIYNYQPQTHKCEENILAMKLKDGSGPWMRVRERKNHREFPGSYALCRCILYKNPIFCKYGEEGCSYAHNDIEKTLWKLEKDGQFDITEFLMQNRKFAVGKGFSLKEVLNKHGGYFEFVCRSCYYGTPPSISLIGDEKSQCSGKPPHSWKDFKILAHMGQSGVTLINPRGFLHKTAFFKICKWLQFCRNRVNAECRFAHSVVERDLWMLERDCSIKRLEIVKESKLIQNIQPASNQLSGSQSKGGMAMIEAKPPPPATVQVVESGDTFISTDGLCPHIIVEVCETCWKKGQKTLREGTKDRCQKGHANWSRNIVYLLSPSNKELRPLPRKIPSGFNFIVCQHVREGRKCAFTGTGPCQFAHSTEEMEAWKYMCINSMKSQQQLSDASKAAQKSRAETAKTKISGLSVVTAIQPSMPIVRPTLPVANIHTYYCHYCGCSCNSQKQWDEHCASEKHNFNVNSDKEHQWNYRQPPWAAARSYELCVKHGEGNKCQYSNVPDMYNLCRYAHGQEELDEWRERYEWRQMKREMARQEKVFSYMDQLLEKYENSQSSIKVISEEVEDVQIKTQGNLHIYKEEKNATYVWTFEVRSKRRLEKVALLYNSDRLHFSLVSGTEKTCQIAQGEMFVADVDPNGQPYYLIQLKFTGGMFGSFQQWILFDFGTEPVPCRKITVEIGDQSSQAKVRNLREQLKFDRWTSQNRDIIRHELNDQIEEQLLMKYKEPSSSEIVVTQTTVTTELNRHNYVPKMHKLLELEEMTRHLIISSYNLCAPIECVQGIEEDVYVYAKPGELFAKVPLQENLTEDTDAGKLILSSVRKVFLAPQNDSSKIIYEATIVREENFNYDGRGREFIYLCLSPEFVKAQNLKSGMSLNVEIQFQMNRLFFCKMHHAVDHLQATDIVFPDVPKINPLRNEKHNLRISSSILNQDQMSAVRHIVADRTGYTPPFVLFGPFGTGKTETLAQATMVLLKEKKDARILICAQSNSAADLYIQKHLNNFLKKTNSKSLLRRVYFKERRVYTVAPEVKDYCLLSPEGDTFATPTKEDIEKHRIVIVTVTSSLLLANMGLQGYFTHIFVDEAAQTLECEALMPLSLATDRTCVVLAGDHKQISPKVYSEEACNQKFHQSLLERLYNYYDSHSTLINESSPLNILLSINYRNKMEILRFLSAVFYGGPDVLKSEANIRSVLSITPLVFYAVQGREVQDINSISYYNMSEVQELVERVDDLYDKWPEEWGPRSAKDIGVVTPYYDQVLLVRKALKKRNMALRDVMVERVQGVQGKEFRAMFLTTVRTRHLIEAPHVQSGALTECDGDSGDFGFLSDPKLLNTALTRAQSLVVVIGDPVVLCAVGECVNVWRTYLKHCQNMSSLYPQNHNYDSIRQQVQDLLNSPARERLLEIANQRQAGKKVQRSQKSDLDASQPTQSAIEYSNEVQLQGSNDELLGQNGAVSVERNGFGGIGMGKSLDERNGALVPAVTNGAPPRSPLTPIGMGLRSRGLAPSPLTMLQPRKTEIYIEIGEDFTVDADDVIKQLGNLVSNAGIPGKTTVSLGSSKNGNVDTSMIKVVEESDHAVMYYNNDVDKAVTVAPANYEGPQLLTLLEDPGKYLRCILHIGPDSYYADVADDRLPVQRIQITSRFMCGQGNDKDEVVIEIIHNGTQVHGKVIGVLKSAIDLKNRYILCNANNENGVMMPLDKGLCSMYNITTASNLSRNLEGYVTLYRFTKSKQIQYNGMEKIMPDEVNSKLFVARFLKWDSGLSLPICVVMGTVPVGSDLSSGMKVLDLDNHVVKAADPALAAEIDFQYPSGFQLTEELYSSRDIDLREMWCFTIDSPTTEDVNRAFSIDEVGDGSYKVGVHVSDVGTFVKKNGSIDLDARGRGASFYPLNSEPVHLLPANLVNQLCSLKPHEDRLAISVLMTVLPTGEVTQVNVQRSVINCKKKYTYREAEDILHDPTAHEDYLKSCVLVLFEISRIWRKERLGTAASYQENFRNKLSPFTHQLVKEMVIMTEFHVAEIIVKKFPYATPLCVQSPPSDVVLNVWKEEHAADAVNSVALTKPFLDSANLETCKCGLACTHTVNYVKTSKIQKRDHIDVVSKLWDSLNEAISMGDITFVQNLIVSAENHPQLAVALLKLQAIQEDQKFICSSDVVPGKRSHYTVNRNPYTQCTLPLTSYMGIVTQRLLLACLGTQTSPYTQVEIQAICNEMQTCSLKCNKYEDDMLRLNLSLALLARPLVTHSILKGVNTNFLHLIFPNIPCYDPEQFELNLLGLCASPESEENGDVILRWQERVYDLAVMRPHQTALGSNFGELNPFRFIYKIPAFQWQRLLIAIREPDERLKEQKLTSALESVRKQVSDPALDGNYIEEVTSEVHKMGKIRHFTDFYLKMTASQVLQVQLSSQTRNGVLSPFIQLFNLTPQLDLCLQHRKNPAQCFVRNLSSIPDSDLSHCLDVSMYEKLMSPLVEMEAVENAVSRNDCITIHNIQLAWKQEPNNVFTAQLALPLNFIKERKIKVTSDMQLKELFSPANAVYCDAYFSDFICVRYSNLKLPDDPSLSETVAMMANNRSGVTWVGHCAVIGVSVYGSDGLVYKLELVQSDVPLPTALVQGLPCTVEILQRTEQDRNILYSMKLLENGSKLAKEIVLRQPVVNTVHYDDVGLLQQLGRCMLHVPNQQQEDALKGALQQSFTVVQGAVATGKSEMAVKLAYMYTQRNRAVKTSKHQVLLCSSTETALDVLTGYFRSLNNSCPKVVRIYGSEIECHLHPSPRDLIRPAVLERDSQSDPVLDNYSTLSLYNLIRSSGSPFGKRINEFDTLFSMYPDDISEDQLDEYIQLVTVAETAVLREAEVILCTCVTSGQRNLATVTNVQQIIVDDCNMCSEPEMIVPLSTYRAVQQVTLIGDVHQLGPVVHSEAARVLGLGKSLLTTYKDTAVSLTVQYRVHENIIDFPSQYCYEGRLLAGNMSQRQPSILNWPGGRTKPSVFCHLDGVETRVTLAGTYTRDQEVVNGIQADFAVRVALSLVSRYQVEESSVAVISITKAQAVDIGNKLATNGRTALKSLSVTEAQGQEFNYVVLSTVCTVPLLSIEVQPDLAWRRQQLGQLLDHRLITVTLTRARKGLVIVGNQALLRCDEMWRKLLMSYDQDKKLVTAESFLQSMSM